MDRSLDEILAERQSTNRRGRGSRNDNGRNRGGAGGRRGERQDYPRDGVRKPFRDREDAPRNLDSEWVHDKFDDNGGRGSHGPRRRPSVDYPSDSTGTRIRVDNIHYELTEEDLDGLFRRIGPIQQLKLIYDRAGRSEGVAYVTYESHQDAKDAIREFDGANAAGQPIRLTLMPSGPAPRSRNPFDSAVVPGRSLAERITVPANRRSSRSLSPGRRGGGGRYNNNDHDGGSSRRRDDVDSYRPGGRDSRSPRPPRGGRREGGRRPGARREGGGAGARGGGGDGGATAARGGRDGRPRKTQEELDAEMDSYFSGEAQQAGGQEANGGAGAGQNVEDIDMIE